MLTYYSENDNKGAKFIDIEADGFDFANAKILVTDENSTMSPLVRATASLGKLTIRLERNSILYIEKQ